ncbi:hypothetical protein [uncultured Microbulbifer sp.]|uniref:hypothetical protein n=1 Tax=uncultured Microbulbifer sp. TaxID=348147 RepID=UPI0026329C36|nr:hypothetical protein [uncultured Microbulbifer sp.]
MKIIKMRYIIIYLLLIINSPANSYENLSEFSSGDSIYISGEKFTLGSNSFVKSGQKYVAIIPVVGDIGQQLIFDIDARVKGYGFYDTGFECHKFYIQPNGSIRIGSGIPPNCDATSVNPSNEFYFSVRMNVTCSNLVIGTNTENRNTLLTSEQLQAIEDSVDRVSGFVVGNPYERNRNLNLLVDASRKTEGQCKELKLELEGLNGTQIYEISSDIIIAEPF